MYSFSEAKKQKVLKEVNNLKKLDSNFVVKYYDSWLESNHLYIQMQFCSQSLKSLLKDKPIVFERQPEEPIDCIFEHFITCEIFKEILQCVQYLHELDPPVIHRDLKPDNILIAHNINNNRFIKLCDFGLATELVIDKGTDARYEHTVVGTSRYMAPEVYYGRYNHKSDIFSLSIIGEQLFVINLQEYSRFGGSKSINVQNIRNPYL
ncbi:unnamed protein product [Medioppia subpectinata]|uniref:non-specific serine/threonine protein kinase n=1 Tax=Medioppia subpectinata TaxID=1979941 RepID=A0A7R9KF82_9ACAR|nr:unnamed protein product [Medioppia subpectinata]CAG2102238.1 unnamed protein product [Medioppia subpectinata]